ncbi:hypothetical protein ScalyP_jg2515 [Parmales sp. scaly parma]|nr:hypothetical protein ScalyP_jg2515 [Parmales sp. scaly parma]
MEEEESNGTTTIDRTSIDESDQAQQSNPISSEPKLNKKQKLAAKKKARKKQRCEDACLNSDATQSQANPSMFTSTSPPPKKKKKRNKAMAAHASYSLPDTTTTMPFPSLSQPPPPPNTSSNTSPNALEEYATNNSQPEPPLLASLRAAATSEFPNATHMNSSPLQGRLLSTLASISRAKKILEIGTFCGYATLSLAESGASVTTLEIDEEAAKVASAHFAMSAYKDKITLHLGPAMDTLKSLTTATDGKSDQEPFDMVFLDADKRAYRSYIDFLLSSNLLSCDCLIICDNVLFKGLVLNSTITGKKKLGKKLGKKKLNYWAGRHQEIADELHAFNEYVNNDKRVDVVLVPLRDGLTLMKRKNLEIQL